MRPADPRMELPLEGPIPDVDVLPRVAAHLGRDEWSGQLVVRSSDAERRLYFLDGHVQTATSSEPSESLTAWMVSAGLIDAVSVEQAATHLGTQDRGLAFGRKLVDLGLLSKEHLAESEERRIVDLAEVVLSSRSGVYRCEVGAPPKEMVSHAFDVPRLIATAVLGRWDPTWAMNVLGGMGAVLRFNTERLPEHEATGADEPYDLTLLRIDGRSTIAEVLQRAPLPELAAVRFLAACRLLGVIEPIERSAPAPPVRRPEPADAAASQGPAPPADRDESREPAAATLESEAESDGDATSPGFYRPAVSAPAPRAEEALMTEPASGSGLGRWLLIAFLVAVLGAVAWFGWIGLTSMSAPASGEPAPNGGAP